ncbi:MAG: type II secretion system F family protein [Planctomycetes bacterium]|nr:type II secretion system F family protein [Planctomycetota bacterium]
MSTSSHKPVSADELIALNREVAGFIRAGLPLELGLGTVSATSERRLGRLTDALAERMRQGLSLPEALDAEGERVPHAYRAVVRAGLRSGRLPAALESLTSFARTFVNVRKRIALALIYPTIVLVVAWVLFAVFLSEVIPTLALLGHGERARPLGWTILVTSAELLRAWGWIVPAAALAFILWWSVSARYVSIRSGPAGVALRLVPGVRRLLVDHHLATLFELLAMLLENGVPLPEALDLAGATAGSAGTKRDAERLAGLASAGQPLAAGLAECRSLPPLARWMISVGEKQGALAATLRQLAVIHTQRVTFRAAWLKTVLPATLVLVLGGGAVALYALGLFGPLTAVLHELARPM